MRTDSHYTTRKDYRHLLKEEHTNKIRAPYRKHNVFDKKNLFSFTSKIYQSVYSNVSYRNLLKSLQFTSARKSSRLRGRKRAQERKRVNNFQSEQGQKTRLTDRRAKKT